MIETDALEEKLKDLLGERVCLDFVNTVSWRGRENFRDYFETYSDLLVWSRYVGILTDKDFKKLQQNAKRHQNETTKVFNRAVRLRETLYAIFSSKAAGRSLKKDNLSTFNRYLSKSMCLSQIIQTEKGLEWNTDGDKDSLDWMLNPIIRSAVELLVSVEIGKVKICGDIECGWIFLDSSRNQSRRWCDMKDCGNRAKARRFYQKQKATQ
jgi:predicted RNA-binding Zn ribbon-like protein